MSIMYVISKETDEIVAKIVEGENYVTPTGRNENEKFEQAFWEHFGPNDYENSFTPFGADFADDIQVIEIE